MWSDEGHFIAKQPVWQLSLSGTVNDGDRIVVVVAFLQKTFVPIYIHTYKQKHSYVFTYIHTSIHTYIHIRMSVHGRPDRRVLARGNRPPPVHVPLAQLGPALQAVRPDVLSTASV